MATLSADELQIERDKLEIERKKHRLEIWKALGSVLGIAVPLVVLAFTLRSNVTTAHEQTQLQFELKAAEIVMQGRNPDDARGRARALKALFPGKLPPDFDERLTLLVETTGTVDKRGLLNLLVANPGRRQEILKLWTTMYPDDVKLLPKELFEAK